MRPIISNWLMPFFFLLILNTSPTAQSENLVSEENKLKAVYIINILKFTEFPKESFTNLGDTIVISVLGDEALFGVLNTFNNKNLKDKILKIQEISRLDSIPRSHIVVVGDNAVEKLDKILRQVSSFDVLSVGNGEDFCSMGGLIGLYLENDKLRIMVNLPELRKTKMKIGSQLMQIAKIKKD